jgi:ribosome recycling factor
MSLDAEINDAKAKLEKALGSLHHDFKHLRTGRASVGMIEHVQVEAYGTHMPIMQTGAVSIPEPTQILIRPFDKSILKAIERALSDANLGMTPQNDGVVIRLTVPHLSTERRQQMAVQAKESTEKVKVMLRNIRRDAIKTAETKGKDQKMSEDVIKKSSEKITDLLKQFEAKAEQTLKDKTAEIMNV